MSTTTPRVFVSHSNLDNNWCQVFVTSLRSAGIDVWYDEHNLAPGDVLMDEISRELLNRSAFVLILSPSSVQSSWVKKEVAAAIHLRDQDAERILLPIMAERCAVPLLWDAYKRISGPRDEGVTPQDAARQVQTALRPRNTVEAETVLRAWERAASLQGQGRLEEAIRAYDRALELDPEFAHAWDNKGDALFDLGRIEDAIHAYEQAVRLSPSHAVYWSDLARAFNRLHRYEDALVAADRALDLNPRYRRAWDHKIRILEESGRLPEAEVVRRQRASSDVEVEVRPANVEDASAVFEMRLMALQAHPLAFGGSFDEERGEAERWRERLRDTDDTREVTFVAVSPMGIVGAATVTRGQLSKKKHVGELWNVFVRPDWRGLRIADRLISACLSWAREIGLHDVKLRVTASNTQAIRVYTRCGFVAYGVEPAGICYDGKFFDQLLMYCTLPESQPWRA